MQCFDFKGGIGTASRVLPADAGGYTVGALVLTNFGGPPGSADRRRAGGRADHRPDAGRSLGGVVRRDRRHGRAAPSASASSRRATRRHGARTHGLDASNGSGEQMLAFSTANRIPVRTADRSWMCARWPMPVPAIRGSSVRLFAATIEATEEAVVNALVAAETVDGSGREHAVRHAGRPGATDDGASGPSRGSLIRRVTAGRNGTDRRVPRRTVQGHPATIDVTSFAVPAPRMTPSEP